jgi:CRP-like cAMP-binding protein/uncharacterized pyridoxamine 5'-phosphate oxidase family protein
VTNQDRPADVPSEVLDYLRGHNTLTLATASPSGLPHAATMIYASEGLALYFCTRPDTTSAHHIEQNPSISFTIDEYSADWSMTKGIQGSGDVQVLLSRGDISNVVSLFRQKFPKLSNVETANLSVFRISPIALQFIDNQSGSQALTGQALGSDWHRSAVYTVFHELPRHEVEAVAARLDTVQVNAGDVLVRQGAPADKFFIITDGEVEVIREDAGQSRTVAHLHRGQFFGEMAILRDMPRTATVKAVKQTTLLAMDRDAFRGLVAQSLGTTEDFDQVIQHRLQELAKTGA